MTKVITRFAPSPTGYLHIGGARTALFNWLLARKNGGEFILRIEDTDLERSREEMTQAILDAMDWLGLDYDQGPYFQSQRLDLYREYIQKLVDTGQAYYCQCTPEEVDAMREEARAKGLKPKYNGRCREKNLGPGPGRVIRLKAPLAGQTAFHDLVKGPIAVNNEELDDFVLQRADGTPTYNLAVVVDDATMGVTHVLRGDDHINNTPKQILIYRALELNVPLFGHVPMILGPDKKKLSKRHGATSVMKYKEMGFLPEAMINYLVRLGWAYGDEEIFSREELIEKFSLENLSKSASVFDMDKLLWLNSHYIKEGDPRRLARLLSEHIRDSHSDLDLTYLEKIVPLLQPRAKTIMEMADQAEFFLVADDQLQYDAKAVQKFLSDEARNHLQEIIRRLEQAETFDRQELENILAKYLEDANIKFKVIAQPIRVAITGRTASPGLFETMEVLGKERTIRRMKRALNRI
ncbi:glutamate--tRNA ligase [Desulfohalobiaceae bacterium Ax17]|uniref:glutamate--tRNA ligase n=1 Tax=Desulfovulcanus ferrireducens TaxID=2831190 RepID=UPI00207BCAF7|nr:glutamate--tRNA ligase [Desulfovulcanus ferrireducens]MBT8764245.1 glutamate--tRNA ligase [Desulfovulcanus ferrireducens]